MTGGGKMTRNEARRLLATLRALTPEVRLRAVRGLPAAALCAIEEEWWWQAHGGQIEPPRDAAGLLWRIWALIAGRGFGKTRAGAEWTWARARAEPEARIAWSRPASTRSPR